MSTLQARIREFMRATGWDVSKIASVAQVTPSAVSQWAGSGSKIIKSIGNLEAALLLERESGFSALWLAKGKGPKMASPRRPACEAPTPRETLETLRTMTADLTGGERARVADLVRGYLADAEESVPTADGICAILQARTTPPTGKQDAA